MVLRLGLLALGLRLRVRHLFILFALLLLLRLRLAGLLLGLLGGSRLLVALLLVIRGVGRVRRVRGSLLGGSLLDNGGLGLFLFRLRVAGGGVL